MDRKVAAAMTEHISALALQAGIKVHWTPRRRGAEAFVDQGTAVIPTVTRPSDYLVGLHELGHILSPDARAVSDSYDKYDVILCEGAAWAWAAAVSDDRLMAAFRKEDWDRIGFYFRSYLRPTLYTKGKDQA
jgi:hypothetical protein